MMILISTIDHSKQRYDTCGDWQWNKYGNLSITVSDMKDWRYNFLVGFHELIEVMLCRARGVTQEQVDDFDKEYEARRLPEDTTSEPGDSILAPYHKEHIFATKLEQLMAEELGVDWNMYENKINSL